MAFAAISDPAERHRIQAEFEGFFRWLGGGRLLIEADPGDALDPSDARLFGIRVSTEGFADDLSGHVPAFLLETALPMAIHFTRGCLVVFGHDRSVMFHFPEKPFAPPPPSRLSFFPR